MKTKPAQGTFTKEIIRIRKILLNLDLSPNTELFDSELRNALGARQYGLTYKEIEKMIEQRVEGLRIFQG